jgi:hypothetical protein
VSSLRVFAAFRKIAKGDYFLRHVRISLTLDYVIRAFFCLFRCRLSSASFSFVSEETSPTMSLLSSICFFRQVLKDWMVSFLVFYLKNKTYLKLNTCWAQQGHLSVIECSMRHFLAIDTRVQFAAYLSVHNCTFEI